MIGRPVIFLSKATADVVSLDAWIAGRAGEEVASNYLERLQRFADFPQRGTPRRVEGEDYRSITFERRYIIIYRITPSAVEVLRVVDARSDLSGLLGG